jgi:cell division septal protein FtsQ
MGLRIKRANRLIARQRVKRQGIKRLAPFAERVRRCFIAVAMAAGCVCVAALVAVVGQLAHHFLVVSPYFQLQHIQTVGLSPEVREELLEIAGLESREGINLLRLDAGAVRRAALRHPRLRAATVTKRYPRSLLIVGEQRKPFAIVSADDFYFIDETATVLGVADVAGDPKAALPFITGVPEARIALGRRIADDQIGDALDLLAALESLNTPIFRDLSEVHLDETEGLSAYLVGGAQIHFGRGSPVHKLPALELFFDNRKPEAIQYVNLRFDGQIIYKPNGQKG